ASARVPKASVVVGKPACSRWFVWRPSAGGNTLRSAGRSDLLRWTGNGSGWTRGPGVSQVVALAPGAVGTAVGRGGPGSKARQGSTPTENIGQVRGQKGKS